MITLFFLLGLFLAGAGAVGVFLEAGFRAALFVSELLGLDLRPEIAERSDA